MMATLALIVFISSIGLLVALAAALVWQMRRFLARTPQLRSAEDVALFRRVVATNMYCALAGFALIITACFSGAALTLLTELSQGQFLVLWGSLLLTLLTAILLVRPLEGRVKSIPATDTALEAARDRVVVDWDRKLFPDW